jgi:hypothetical protein
MKLYKVHLGYVSPYGLQSDFSSYVLAENEKEAGEKLMTKSKERDYNFQYVTKIEFIADTDEHYFHSKLIM